MIMTVAFSLFDTSRSTVAVGSESLLFNSDAALLIFQQDSQYWPKH